jgi:hypothetical protein
MRIEREVYQELCAVAKEDDRSVANFIRLTLKQAVKARMIDGVHNPSDCHDVEAIGE